MNDKKRLQEIKEKIAENIYQDMLFVWRVDLSKDDVNWLIKQAEVLQKLKENIIDTMQFAEKENSMYDNDYVRGIYHAYKDILADMERLEGKK
jgi:hypothetical protein